MSDKKKADQQQDNNKKELDALNAKYLRALADYQNLEKRMNTSVEQARMSARKEMLMKFIDVLDSLEKAEIFVTDPGLKMVMEGFHKVLADAGVEEINIVGQEYDPYMAEAVEVVTTEDAKQDNTVAEVVRKGYKLGNDIIRPAQVKVFKAEI